MTTRSVLILAPVVLAAFGVLVWWRSRRRGTPESVLTLVVGLAGLYASAWGAVTREHWLYGPGGALVVASYGLDFAARRRSGRMERAGGSHESPASGE